MEEEAVRDTEALTYDADDGIKVGFADRLGALDDELAIFAEDAETGDDEMADIKKEDHDKAVAEARTEGLNAGKAEGKADGLKEGATAQKTRIKAIIASDEGKKRPKAAYAAAMNTEMSLEEATAFLKDMPEEKAEAVTEKPGKTGAKTEQTPFEAAMNGNNPDVGGGEGGEGEGDASDKAVNSILADYGGVRGVKANKAA